MSDNKLPTVNSLSGGRTSSYIAVYYPADHELFALVCIDDHNAGRDLDKKLVQRANDKLQKYCSDQNEFVATAEDPKILKVMFDLEQKIGREIVWLRGMGWEDMIRFKRAMPNIQKRFCTTVTKMMPIFNYLFKYVQLPVDMSIGFRWDEAERANNFKETFKFPYKCQYQPKSNRWIQRWNEINWRTGRFQLIKDKKTHHDIAKYWGGRRYRFSGRF